MTQGQKFASCLPFNTAMAMGFNIIGIHEGTGWSFHNIVHILYLTICLYVKSAVNLVKMFRFFKNPTYLAEYFRRGSAVEQLPQSALCRRQLLAGRGHVGSDFGHLLPSTDHMVRRKRVSGRVWHSSTFLLSVYGKY